MSRRAARDAGMLAGTPDTGAPQTPEPGEKTGIAAVFARHPKAWLGGALGLVFVLLGTGAILAGAAVGTGETVADETPGTDLPEDTARVVPDAIPAATGLRTCSIASLTDDDRLGRLRAYVVNTGTGEALYSLGGTKSASPASVAQLITATAAITVLGPDHRISTKVYTTGEEGTIVLVGGGDPTISNTDPGTQSFYTDAPKLSALADAVKLSLGETPITNIILDSSYWSESDSWDSTWNRSEQTKGYLSEVTALQVDGDRSDPTKSQSPRTEDPVMHAGELFAEKLGVPGVTLTVGSVPEGSVQIAEIESQPVSSLVNTMLLTSDQTLAETLARVTSKEAGSDGSASSLQAVFAGVLTELGLDIDGLVIRDGSGQSVENQATPRFMTQLIAKILDGGNNLNYVYNSLPVAGKTGTLSDRFTGANEVAVDNVIAKTGWISSERSLAGVIQAEDGSTLAFAFYALKDGVESSAKAALDSLATGIYKCGDNLAGG